MNDVEVLRRYWPVSSVETFNGTNALAAWQSQWPAGNSPAAKVVYDRSAGEVLVFSRGENKPKVFVIVRDLAGTLLEVDRFIRQQVPNK